MSFSRLQTPEILQARRMAYELDLFWPPTVGHAAFARHIVAGQLDGLSQPSLGSVERLREAADGTLERALYLNFSDARTHAARYSLGSGRLPTRNPRCRG